MDRSFWPTYEKELPMLYDRPYMRSEDGSGSLSTVKGILIVLVGAFLVQSILELLLQSSIPREWFSLSKDTLINRFLIWTPLTYALLHGGLFHLLFNGLGIFFLGRPLENRIGSARLLSLFLFSILLGGLTWIVVTATAGLSSMSYLLGASAGALGILTVFCILFANETIQLLLFFILPISIKPKYLLMAVLAIEGFSFVFMELTGSSGVAHSAHLGGILGGYLYFRYLMNRDTLFQKKSEGVRVEMPDWFKRKERGKKPKATVNLSSRSELKSEIDRILDKINSKGFGSLSEEEKRLLDKARDMLNR